MTTEQPYPDMTDRDVLETILQYALQVMETNKPMGDDLWNIHKYLEKRLTEAGPQMESPTVEEIEKVRENPPTHKEEIEGNIPEENPAKIVIHTESVTINNY